KFLHLCPSQIASWQTAYDDLAGNHGTHSMMHHINNTLCVRTVLEAHRTIRCHPDALYEDFLPPEADYTVCSAYCLNLLTDYLSSRCLFSYALFSFLSQFSPGPLSPTPPLWKE